MMLLLAVVIGELFLFTWSRVECRRMSRLITQSSEDYRQQVALQKKLNIELAHLKSPKRISTIAKRELGLGMPDQDRILSVK